MSEGKYFQADNLLTPPTQRSAYSDRMAYVCAELSRLAYFSFEGGATAQRLLATVDRALETLDVSAAELDDFREDLKRRFDFEDLDSTASKELFRDILKKGGFELIDTFYQGDTQGFVCARPNGDTTSAFLVYRGTESIGDALDDLNAYLTKEPFEETDASELHQGFYTQFMAVDSQVKALLKLVEGSQLFITGHSLGGALAVLATRFYSEDTSGATYTFGAPAVSNPDFQYNIKTPIYRVVNATDPVPRVPSIYTGFFLQFINHWLQKLLALFGVSSSKQRAIFIRDLKQYRQNGYDAYILRKNNKVILRLGSSLSFYDRAVLWFGQIRTKTGLRTLGDNHKIEHYVDYLRNWAQSRN